MIDGYVDFEFNLPDALLHKLVDVFDQLNAVPLSTHNLSKIPQEQGVYQLFLVKEKKQHLVYIGKTDAKQGLNSRLLRHEKRVQHRLHLDPGEVFFKAVRIYVFTAVDLEAQLIKHYNKIEAVAWDKSGFGSNDPGQERDTTNYKATHFDAQFPVDIKRALSFQIPMCGTASLVLQALNSGLPYTIRFQGKKKGSRQPHDDLEQTVVEINKSLPLTPESIICQVISRLPSGWDAILLPSYVIIYKDVTKMSANGKLVARSP